MSPHTGLILTTENVTRKREPLSLSVLSANIYEEPTTDRYFVRCQEYSVSTLGHVSGSHIATRLEQ